MMRASAYALAREVRQSRALAARAADLRAVADYREALDRLRDAQARYELNRDDRASDHEVSRAIRDVLIARADLESIRRRYPAMGDIAY